MDNEEKIREIGKKTDPLDKAILLGATRQICRLADKHTDNNVCEVIYEKSLLEQISIEDNLRKNLGLCSKDKQAKETLRQLLDAHIK